MDPSIYQREILRAEKMAQSALDLAEYWYGYRSGLLRAFFGRGFGAELDIETNRSLERSEDPRLAARGRGYVDGLAFGSALHD